MPQRHFGVIAADPPWTYKTFTDEPGDRAAPYSTMKLDEIKRMPVADLAAPTGCHLFLWTTGPHLRQAFDVIDAWGFKYSGVGFVWIKLKRSHDPNQLRVLPSLDGDFHVGMGFTTRKNAEFCLLARRGAAKRIAKNIRELILEPVREHSRKPDEAFRRIERYAAGPFIDLFSRENREGWTSWGNETGKFNAS
jgi:N6-adenosine-specific RNA methylase IME4